MLSWSDFSDGAAWKATRKTHESFKAECAAEGKPMPVLLSDVVGLRLENIMVNVLHCVDQGVGAHVIGNMFLGAGQRWSMGQAEHQGELVGAGEGAEALLCRDEGELQAAREADQGEAGWPEELAKLNGPSSPDAKASSSGIRPCCQI